MNTITEQISNLRSLTMQAIAERDKAHKVLLDCAAAFARIDALVSEYPTTVCGRCSDISRDSLQSINTLLESTK